MVEFSSDAPGWIFVEHRYRISGFPSKESKALFASRKTSLQLKENGKGLSWLTPRVCAYKITLTKRKRSYHTKWSSTRFNVSSVWEILCFNLLSFKAEYPALGLNNSVRTYEQKWKSLFCQIIYFVYITVDGTFFCLIRITGVIYNKYVSATATGYDFIFHGIHINSRRGLLRCDAIFCISY